MLGFLALQAPCCTPRYLYLRHLPVDFSLLAPVPFLTLSCLVYTHVILRSCCSSYFSSPSFATMRFPSSCFSPGSQALTARWTSSMAPVCPRISPYPPFLSRFGDPYNDNRPTLSSRNVCERRLVARLCLRCFLSISCVFIRRYCELTRLGIVLHCRVCTRTSMCCGKGWEAVVDGLCAFWQL